MKPIHSVGSRGVYRIFSEADLELARSEIGDCPYEAEEFIGGQFFHVDFAIQDKNVLFAGISEYSCSHLEYQEGKNMGCFVLTQENEFTRKMKDFAFECIKALGFYNGVYHMEVFYKNEELVFLETAIRPAGLYCVTTYEAPFGVNLYDTDFKIQIGERMETGIMQDPENRLKASYFVIPKRNGTIKEFLEPKIKNKYKLEWNVKQWDAVTQTKTNIDFAGYIMIENINADDLFDDFNYIRNEYLGISYE
jgi:biotin carboxylase